MSITRFQKINGNTLKIVACISMLIDHVTAGLMYPVVKYGYYDGNLSIAELNKIYIFLRAVGRTAFPIYAFLLVEGFMHTKSRLRYALSLLLFAFISEIPFDLLFYSEEMIFTTDIPAALQANSYLLYDQCNVFFTLFISFMVMWAMESTGKFIRSRNIPIIFSWLSIIVFILSGCAVAYRINSDYDLYGVLLVSIFYLLKNHDVLRVLGGYMFISNLSIEFASFPGFILMLLYSKKQGRKLGLLKYLFYFYYPAHILCIYLIRGIIYG
jgi:hypothetical protein